MCLVAVATALILAVIVWQASAGIGTQPVIQRATAAW